MSKTIKRLIFCLAVMFAAPALAQDAEAPIQKLLQEHGDVIAKSSRKTIGPAIDALAASGLPAAQRVLERWQAKDMWRDEESGLFVFAEEIDRDTIRVFDPADGAQIGAVPDKGFKQLKPNSGIRGMIGAALVQFQLGDPDPVTRATALDAIERDPEASHLAALRKVVDSEGDPKLKARKARLERLLTIRFDTDDSARIKAIESMGMLDDPRAEEFLQDVYETENNVEVKGAVLEAMMWHENVDLLIRIARTESNMELKRRAVEALAMSDSPKATEFLLELLDE